MAGEAEGERALHGMREGQTPEAAEAVGLGEPATVAETPEMNRAALPIFSDVHFVEPLQNSWFGQSAFAAFTANLIFAQLFFGLAYHRNGYPLGLTG